MSLPYSHTAFVRRHPALQTPWPLSAAAFRRGVLSWVPYTIDVFQLLSRLFTHIHSYSRATQSKPHRQIKSHANQFFSFWVNMNFGLIVPSGCESTLTFKLNLSCVWGCFFFNIPSPSLQRRAIAAFTEVASHMRSDYPNFFCVLFR